MPPRQKPLYTVLIRYPTWFSGSQKTSNGNRNCYFDFASTCPLSLSLSLSLSTTAQLCFSAPLNSPAVPLSAVENIFLTLQIKFYGFIRHRRTLCPALDTTVLRTFTIRCSWRWIQSAPASRPTGVIRSKPTNNADEYIFCGRSTPKARIINAACGRAGGWVVREASSGDYAISRGRWT